MNNYKALCGGLAILSVSALSACSNLYEEFYVPLTDPALANGGTGGTGATTTIDPGCIPSNASNPIDASCGVFVSSSKGDDTNQGTKDEPFATIEKALGAAKGKPVYLCAETFTGAIAIGGGALLYGGLDCTDGWKYVGTTKSSEITAPPDEIPLRVGANNSVELYDVAIRAADALKKGGSSIALLAEAEADVMLTRCTVEAGNGASGADGEPFVGAALAGQVGTDGGEACSAGTVIGAEGPVNECGEIDSFGGNGGNGTQNSGSPGGPGDPFVNDNGGTGENAVNACQPGTEGAAGMSGAAGDGATTLGTLDATSGFAGVSGSEGKPGTPGQGGGGGGGAKGGSGGGKCASLASAGGASGGSGGSGGCGGLGGKGGSAGGASIAIVSLTATLTFSEVTITAKDGGKGGNGGAGQAGGAGAAGGAGGTVPNMVTLNAGCAGGSGGPGGAGGQGGGGRGGHSIGIAHAGKSPAADGATITAGTAGDGGSGEGATGSGEAGVAIKMQLF